MNKQETEYTIKALKAIINTFTGADFGHDLRHLTAAQKGAIGMVYNAISKLENHIDEAQDFDFDSED